MTSAQQSTNDSFGAGLGPATAAGSPAEPRPPWPTAPVWRHRTALAAAVLCAVVAVAALPAQPAAASAPQCNATTTWRMHDANGDPYGGSAPFDYTITTPTYRSSSGTNTAGCWLSKGSTGGDVLALQRTINHCYGSYWNTDPGGILLGIEVTEDGIYGSQTAAALAKIQSYFHITADGVYGPSTATHIRHRGSETTGDWPGPLCHTLGG